MIRQLVLTLLLISSSTVFSAQKIPSVYLFTSAESEGDPRPIIAIEPEFPEQALNSHTQGRVTVAYQIDRRGRANAIEIVFAEPEGVFDNAVIRALKASRFEPPSRPNSAVYQQVVIFTLRHPIAEPWKSDPTATPLGANDIDETVALLVRITPRYPQNALDQKLSGTVTVEFTIDPHGSVIDPVIMKSSSTQVFDEAALRAITLWKFKPAIKDGKRVALRAVQLIEFDYDLVVSTQN